MGTAIRLLLAMGLRVTNAGFEPVNGSYSTQPHTSVPASFDLVCQQQGWDTTKMWSRLNGGRDWYKHESNESYIYYNNADGKWWIDGPDGMGGLHHVTLSVPATSSQPGLDPLTK